jgi:hypothetical protein
MRKSRIKTAISFCTLAQLRDDGLIMKYIIYNIIKTRIILSSQYMREIGSFAADITEHDIKDKLKE